MDSENKAQIRPRQSILTRIMTKDAQHHLLDDFWLDRKMVRLSPQVLLMYECVVLLPLLHLP